MRQKALQASAWRQCTQAQTEEYARSMEQWAEAHAAHVTQEAEARVAEAEARVARYDAAERGLDELAGALAGGDSASEFVTMVKLMKHMRKRKNMPEEE